MQTIKPCSVSTSRFVVELCALSYALLLLVVVLVLVLVLVLVMPASYMLLEAGSYIGLGNLINVLVSADGPSAGW